MERIVRDHATSSATWETLEAFARAQVQDFIQQLLEDEVPSCWAGRSRRAAPSWMRRAGHATATGRRGSWPS